MAQWYAGGCPPGWSQPAPGYDCRPNVSGQVVQQENLARIAAHYIDDGSTDASGIQSTGAPSQGFYTAQPPSAITTGLPASGGGDNTMLLLLAAVALIFVLKK